MPKAYLVVCYRSISDPQKLAAYAKLAPTATAPHVVMVNVLGGDDPDLYGRLVHVMAADPGIKVHLYGKAVRPGRKVGHVTAVGDDVEDLRGRARRAASYLRHGTEQD